MKTIQQILVQGIEKMGKYLVSRSRPEYLGHKLILYKNFSCHCQEKLDKLFFRQGLHTKFEQKEVNI